MTIETILFFVATGAALVAWKFYKQNKELQEQLRQSQSSLHSAFVKFGKSFEHFVPFTKDFPSDKEKTVFLGMPIDFISFDQDTIKFIEVKTGNSQLSPKQKYIQQQIKNGHVEFKELRYNHANNTKSQTLRE